MPGLGQMIIRPPTLVAQDTAEVLVDGSLTSGDWLRAGAILLATILVSIIVSRLLRRVISHGLGTGFASIMLARLASYVAFLVGLFYALTTLGVRVGPLVGALGLGGLVLALALQRVVENFVSSIILQARRPFTIGDTVQLDGWTGVVADIDSRTTLLRALDGSHVRLPNSTVTSTTIVNLTREPRRRSSLEVGVAYETDLVRARETLTEAIARVPRVRTDPVPSVNLVDFGDSSIGFSILYWHDSDVPSELAARTDLMIAVHQALTAAEITIAFPQMVVWSGIEQNPAYVEPPDEVFTDHPGLDAPSSSPRKRVSPNFRRPTRRKSGD